MKDLKVWMRVGDQDDYHDFDSPDEAASDLAEWFGDGSGAVAVRRYNGPMLHGIEIEPFYIQENGISLFWGDGDAQFECELSDVELEAFINALSAGVIECRG